MRLLASLLAASVAVLVCWLFGADFSRRGGELGFATLMALWAGICMFIFWPLIKEGKP